MNDLTTGAPIKAILKFSLPIVLGNLFQQIYNLVDAAIVGKFVGVEALAGVGSTGTICYMIIGFAIGVCTGFCIPVAQSFGAQDYDSLKKYFAHAFVILAVLATVLTSFTLAFVNQILTIMQTPDSIFLYAKTYLSVMVAGIPGILLYNLFASVLRSIGDSKTPVFFLIGSAILNVILDLSFIIGMNMGVFGAGLATVLSQTLAGVLCMILTFKKVNILKLRKKDFIFDIYCVKRLCRIGFPMGFQVSITAIGGAVLQASINGLGATYVAAVTAASKINVFTSQGLEACGLAMATYVGQNMGAKKLDRVTKGVKQVLIAGVCYSVVMMVFLHFTSDYLSLIFVSSEEVEIISCIGLFLTVNSIAYLSLNVLLVLRNTIQGLGYSSFAMFAGGMEMVARMLVGLAFVPMFGFAGATLSNMTAWTFAVIFLVPAYIHIMKKVKVQYKLAEK